MIRHDNQLPACIGSIPGAENEVFTSYFFSCEIILFIEVLFFLPPRVSSLLILFGNFDGGKNDHGNSKEKVNDGYDVQNEAESPPLYHTIFVNRVE